MNTTEERTIYRACNLCEAICGLEFRVRGDEILSIRGDAEDPLSHGHICPKAVALQDIQNDPDRLRGPVRRVGEEWQAISWDEAFAEVAERLAEIHQQHGANAIGAYLGNPSVHNYGVLTHSQFFFGLIKTRSRFSATSVDQLPHQLLASWMYGHQFLIPIPDIDRCQYFLVLGGNPMASNGSIMTVPGFPKRLKALQARGGRMVVIDPRRSETAEVADAHHFIRPGTDAALLMGILQVLVSEGLTAPGHLAAFTDGLDDLTVAMQAVDLAACAHACGIAEADIRDIARDIAQADGAAVYGRMGVSTQRYGALCQWLIQCINLLTGNLDREGGVMFTRPAVEMVESPTSRPGHFNAWQSRVSGLPEFGGELPVSTMAEEILTPGEGQIRALVTVAGNPVLSTPNGGQLDKALASLDFMLAIDPYINETTRHADIILPPTTPLEHDHHDLIFHVFAVRNTVRHSPAVFDKPKGALHDWEIFLGLAERLAPLLGKAAPGRVSPAQIIDMGLRTGPYAKPDGERPGLSLAALESHPHGLDLGPLQPCLPQRLFHADKRIRVAIPEMLADLQRANSELLAAEPAPGLKLIGRRHVRSNNSWMHNYHRLVKGRPRCTLLMHPDDVQALGLADGQKVRVQSRVGKVEVMLEQSDCMMPGVVSLPHGWGHDRKGIRMGTATEHAGVSVNDLTDERHIDPVSGNNALNGVPVEVRAA